MEAFEIKYEQVVRQLTDLKTWVYNQVHETSLTSAQLKLIMDRVESISQELVSAADSLSN